MSVATRLQAMQPTDVGVPGPTSLDMARAFRSIRADPLTFLGEVSAALRRPRLLPGARRAGAAGQRPGRRPARAADLGAQLGQGDRAVRRPGAGHRSRPAGLVRAELDRAPTARRPGLPPPAAGGGGRRGARGRRHRHRRAARAGPPPTRCGRAVVDVAALTHRIGLDAVGRALFSTDLSGQAQRAAGRDERGGRPGGPAGPLDPADAPSGPRPGPTSGCARARRRLDADRRRDHRRSDGPATPAPARRRLARRRPPRPAARQRPDRRRDPRRAGHHGHRRPRDRGGRARLDADAAGRAPAGPGPRARRARRPSRPGARCSATASALPWTRAVVDEALRLFPPAWALSRRSHARRRHRRPRRSRPARWSSSAPGSCTVAPTRGPTRWPSVPSASSTPAPARTGLPAVRAGAAAVHRARVRARRDGRGPQPSCCASTGSSVPHGLDPPGGAGAGRRAPARRHAARRHPLGRARRDADLVLARRAAGRRGAVCGRLAAAGPPDGPARSRGHGRRGRRRCRSSSRRGTRRPRSRRCWRRCGELAAGGPEVVVVDDGSRDATAAVARAARSPRRCPPALRRPGGRARPGPATSAPRATSGRPAALPRRRHRAGPGRAGRPAGAARPARRAGVGAAASTTSCGPTSSCRRTSTWSSLLASGAFARRPRERGRWPSGRAC